MLLLLLLLLLPVGLGGPELSLEPGLDAMLGSIWEGVCSVYFFAIFWEIAACSATVWTAQALRPHKTLDDTTPSYRPRAIVIQMALRIHADANRR